MCALKGIRELCQAGAEAQNKGDHLAAEFFLRQALRQAVGVGSPVLEAKILNTMGVFSMASGSASKSVPLFAGALERVRRRIGEGNKLYTVINNNLHEAERLSLAAQAA